jgi:predicted RecB family nuclease
MILLTDELLLNYQRCHRRAFLEISGNPSDREPPGDYLRKIMTDSAQNRRTILNEAPYSRPDYPRGDWQAGVAATLELMRQGCDRIYHGLLTTPGPRDSTLLVKPDLLVREPGASALGDWRYGISQVKLSRRPKLEYQLTATFQTSVLAAVQQVWPDGAWLILRGRSPYRVPLADRLPEMESLLQDCLDQMIEGDEPDVFIARSRCSMCSWYGHCHAIATEQRHLSLLPGVTPKRYDYLQELGITTLAALEETDPAILAPLPGFGPEVAQRLVDQAYASLTDRPVLIGNFPRPPRLQAPIELFFDIEAEPELELAYLHGVLVLDRFKQRQTFHGLIAEKPEEEQRVWEEFVALVSEYRDAPIFHFCSYEAETVRRYGVRYGTDPAVITQILDRFIDVHYWATQTAIMPVESYALKNLARWVGFDWRDADANGAQSIFWYDEWLATGDRSYLDRILRYNEDDCVATYRVKEWLAEFVWGMAQPEVG